MTHQETEHFSSEKNENALHYFALYVVLIIIVAIIIIGTIGNVLVLLAVKLTPKLQTPSNVFIVNLSLCDLTVVLLILPFNIYTYIQEGWDLAEWLCKALGYAGYSLAGTTLINMCLIGWNRYKLVTDLASHREIFNPRKVSLLVFLSWMMPVIFLLPSLLEVWGRFGFVTMLATCNLMLGHDSLSFKLFLLMVRITVPLILLIYCYTIIYQSVHSSHGKMTTSVSNKVTMSRHYRIQERHLSRMICVMFVVFALSYLPCTVTGFIDWNYVMSKRFHMYCEVSVYISSALNPIIYGLMNSQFREAYVGLLRCKNQSTRDKGSVTRYTSLKMASSPSFSRFRNLAVTKTCDGNVKSVLTTSNKLTLSSTLSASLLQPLTMFDSLMPPVNNSTTLLHSMEKTEESPIQMSHIMPDGQSEKPKE